MHKPKPKYQDPIRHPKLQEPVENSMLNLFPKFIKGVMIDVSLELSKKSKKNESQ